MPTAYTDRIHHQLARDTALELLLHLFGCGCRYQTALTQFIHHHINLKIMLTWLASLLFRNLLPYVVSHATHKSYCPNDDGRLTNLFLDDIEELSFLDDAIYESLVG